MSENEIKPVAWMVDEQGMTGQLGTKLYWARNGGIPPSFGQNHFPLFDQSAIDRLTAERDEAVSDAERYDFCVRHRTFPVLAQNGKTWVMFVPTTSNRRASFFGKSPTEVIDAARAKEASK